MTYQQFLRRDGDDAHFEWVDGGAVPMSRVSGEHVETAMFLLALLQGFIEAHDLGVLRHRPFQMKTGPDLPGRSPDLCFVRKVHAHRLKRYFVAGPGDLVIEILDAGSRRLDRGQKFSEYEQGGVQEYWLIDPERKKAAFYGLGRDGDYHLLPIADGVFRSAVMKALWLKVDWLWKRPPLLKVLKEWRLV
jgi:Uma2 family endonuclease